MRKEFNLERLKKCMYKAQNGEELTIGFLGGSITEGALATEPEKNYAHRVFSWWKEAFPKGVFHYVNGGIGGTNSHYGVARAVTDLLMYQPDFVVVDFCVNDRANSFFQETYEGVIRRLLNWNSSPAVLLLNNVFYDTGENAQDYHNAVGDWYHIPYVSVRDTIYQRMKKGEYTREELSPDGIHPNDKGHALVAGEIIAFLENVKENLKEKEEVMPVPGAMTCNAYENAKRLTIREVSPVLDGFKADTEEKTGHLDHFKNGWIGKKAGDRITFEAEASCIAVQYRKTIKRPAVRARLVLDGDHRNGILLDGNFEEDWGDCLYLESLLHHGTKTRHVVEIEVLPEDGRMEEMTPFYLMSLIIA